MSNKLALLLCGCLLLNACIPAVQIRKSVDDASIHNQSQQNPAIKWQVGLGVSVIEQMQIVDADRMLVLLKHDNDMLSNGDIVLLERHTGNVIWRYSRDAQAGEYALVLLTEKALIFSVNSENKNHLISLNIKTGQKIWQQSFSSSVVHYLPLPKVNSLLIVEYKQRAVHLYGFNPFDGQVSWKHEYKLTHKVPGPVVSSGEIWHFFNGVEKLDGSNGKQIWRQHKITFANNSPPAQLQGHILFLVDKNNRLHGLSTASGKSLLSMTLEDRYQISNIYPLADRIYLRGEDKNKTPDNLSALEKIKRAAEQATLRALGMSGADGKDHVLLALSKKTGKLIWNFNSKEPSVSNLIEKGNSLYHGTASRLIALDRRTGKSRFNKVVTNAGRNYPVHIRLVGNRVVFLGEWIVAAFDQGSGKQSYAQGMDPVPDSRATMSGLDDTVKKLRNEVSANNQTGQSITESLNQDVMRFQNLANHYQQQAFGFRSLARGSSGGTMDHYFWKALQSQNQAQVEGAFSSAYSSIAMTTAIWEFNASLEKAFHQTNIKSAIADASLFRKAILGGFTKAENQDYYYRPHNNLNGFVGVSIVNLHTGKRVDAMLSPGYQDYGLWNIIDLSRGVIYHHGIGLNTQVHRFIEQERGMNTFMIYESYLIAQPVKLP